MSTMPSVPNSSTFLSLPEYITPDTRMLVSVTTLILLEVLSFDLLTIFGDQTRHVIRPYVQ